MSKLFDVLVAVIILAVIGAVVLANEDSCYVQYQRITKQVDSTGPGQFVIDSVGVAKIKLTLNLKPITVEVCPGDTLMVKGIVKQLYYWAGVPKAKLDSVANANVRVK